MGKSADAFRTISEVAEWLDTPAHVLRFWESKFTQIKPIKRAGGRRYYRPADMELIGGIKKLLHDDGMTIKGVQKILREQGVKHVSSLSQSIDGNNETSDQVEGAPLELTDVAEEETGTVLNFRAAEPDDANDPESEPGLAPVTDEALEPDAPEIAHEAPGSEDDQDDIAAQVDDDLGDTPDEPEEPQEVYLGATEAAAEDLTAPFEEVQEEKDAPQLDIDELPAFLRRPSPFAKAEDRQEEHDDTGDQSESISGEPSDPEDNADSLSTEENEASSTPTFAHQTTETPEVPTPESEPEPTRPAPLGIGLPDDPDEDSFAATAGLLTNVMRIGRLSGPSATKAAPLVQQLKDKLGAGK